MTLENLQHKMHKLIEDTDWEAWRIVHNCEEMLQSQCSPRSIKAFYEIGESFVGRPRLLKILNQDYEYYQPLRIVIGV